MTAATENSQSDSKASTQDELAALGWAALPASYRIPETAPTLDEARAYCRLLAESHYENFHVVSRFLPKALRPHFHSIYAYCRISDDLGDEVPDTICGDASWMPAMRAGRGTRCLWRWPRRSAPARFPNSRLPIC
jgi:hypothetical protein